MPPNPVQHAPEPAARADAPTPEASDAHRGGDALFARYRAIARRAHALVGAPAPDRVGVPEAIVREIEDVVHRLGPYVSAMPGARALSAAEIAGLRDVELPDASDVQAP
jgi:hypothetical protein